MEIIHRNESGLLLGRAAFSFVSTKHFGTLLLKLVEEGLAGNKQHIDLGGLFT